jgi:hypothetical protein
MPKTAACYRAIRSIPISIRPSKAALTLVRPTAEEIERFAGVKRKAAASLRPAGEERRRGEFLHHTPVDESGAGIHSRATKTPFSAAREYQAASVPPVLSVGGGFNQEEKLGGEYQRFRSLLPLPGTPLDRHRLQKVMLRLPRPAIRCRKLTRKFLAR